MIQHSVTSETRLSCFHSHYGIITMLSGPGCGRGDDLPLNDVVVAARRTLAPHIPLLNTPLVGTEAALQEVQRLLGLTAGAPHKVGTLVVGMYGMGGVGKTTLATKVRDEAPAHFGGRIVRLHIGDGCFGSGLVAKRSELLQLLCLRPPDRNMDLDDVSNSLRWALKTGGPLLLILDDLWTRHQLPWLLGYDNDDIEQAVANMAAGSRLLLTSRDQEVLDMKWAGFSPFELRVLEGSAAERLLCLEAQKTPSDFRNGQLQQTLLICGGLPLALQILGRQLRDFPAQGWQVQAILSFT